MHFRFHSRGGGSFPVFFFLLAIMSFHEDPKATVCFAFFFFIPTEWKFRLFLLRAERKKDPVKFSVSPSVAAVPFPHFCITRRTFSGLLNFSAHLQEKRFVCKREGTPPVLEAAGVFTKLTFTYSPVTLVELLVVWEYTFLLQSVLICSWRGLPLFWHWSVWRPATFTFW